MAASMVTSDFGVFADETGAIILNKPVVIKELINDWPCRAWKPEYLSSILGNKKVRFRIGTKNEENCSTKIKGVQWEGDCRYEEATIQEFCEWCRQCPGPKSLHRETPDPVKTESSLSSNPLMAYDRSKHWCYADYKYMMHLFEGQPDVLEGVRWKDLGFADRDGRHSTIWIGSEGANTPCHQDTYGFNLVAQIAGRKKWHLFPPAQTDLMYPTRLPYEESSVFSHVNVKQPDLGLHPKFGGATPHVVVLSPGDVLFVPKHWWHYVESLDDSISINCWMDVDSDHLSRTDEAITRTLVCGLMSSDEDADDVATACSWLNPTELATNQETNMRYLQAALQALLDHEETKSVRNLSVSSLDSCDVETESHSVNQSGDASNDVHLPDVSANSGQNHREGIFITAEVEKWDSCSKSVKGNHKKISSEMRTATLQNDSWRLESYSRGQRSSEACQQFALANTPTENDFSESCGQSSKSGIGWGEIYPAKRMRGSAKQGPNQSESGKRLKRSDIVMIPGSCVALFKHSVVAVPCLGTISMLTKSNKGNDSTNLKIDQVSSTPSGSFHTDGNARLDVSMETLVECLTHPRTIASVRQMILEKVYK